MNLTNKYIILLVSLFLSNISVAQERGIISGYVTDKNTGENLRDVTVRVDSLKLVTYSNSFGHYSISVSGGAYVFSFESLGYQPFTTIVNVTDDKSLDVALVPLSHTLNTVTVVGGDVNKDIESTQMSTISISPKEITDAPALLGEADPLKYLQLLPGVQSGSEGSTGLYVRGGSPDQNLFLLDGIPLYNVSHLFGFFSVFNSDAIANVKLYKGAVPARFGGRLSSVVDISLKEGNLNEHKSYWSSSIIASSLTLEGPIKKNQSSYLLSIRRTYLDLLAKPFISLSNNGQAIKITPSLNFWDINAKTNFKINSNNRIYFSQYSGNDYFNSRVITDYPNFKSEFNSGMSWGNNVTALRWNHRPNSRFFLNTTLYTSQYRFNTEALAIPDYSDSVSYKQGYFSKVRDYALRVEGDYFLSALGSLKFGTSIARHNFSPGASSFTQAISDSTVQDTLVQNLLVHSIEGDNYIESNLKLNHRIKANLGLHHSYLIVNGESYSYLQPRVSTRIKLHDNHSIKMSYAELAQFVNLLANEGIGLPTDLWVPSTLVIKPQTSQQLAAGYYTKFNSLQISSEVYYKRMKNVVSYREGTSFLYSTNLLDETWEDKITQGNGTSYGLELLIKKEQGRTTGWIGYTLSWSMRVFEELNNGNPFFYTYDRRHDLSLVLKHKLTKAITLSGSWIYASGRAITIPDIQYQSGLPGYMTPWDLTIPISVVTEKNSTRMSDVHRLDLSITKKITKPNKTVWWGLSVYNAYNHLNPFFVMVTEEQDNTVRFREYGLFPIIPTFTYRFTI
jgi:hypothetical protein